MELILQVDQLKAVRVSWVIPRAHVSDFHSGVSPRAADPLIRLKLAGM
jgi:hypothetical protein